MYKSYFQFFSDLKSIINDIKIDFSMSDLSGEAFDKSYTYHLNKIVDYCKTYSDDNVIFKGKSAVIAAYISEIRSTKTYPQSERFDVMLDITDNFIRRVM